MIKAYTGREFALIAVKKRSSLSCNVLFSQTEVFLSMIELVSSGNELLAEILYIRKPQKLLHIHPDFFLHYIDQQTLM